MVGNKELRKNDGMRGIWTLFAFELFSYTDISCLKGSHVAYCSLFITASLKSMEMALC